MWPKIDILEKALKDLLEKQVTNLASTGTPALQKDFILAFRTGLLAHFAVEREALFPELQKLGNNASTTTKELLADHDIMIKSLADFEANENIPQDKARHWFELLVNLGAHNRKEEATIPPLVRQLTTEQLRKIDETARNLGYNL